MWIRKTVAAAELKRVWDSLKDLERTWDQTRAQNIGLERMNARLQSDLDWAKHRLNQMERERALLIQSAIGVKVPAPEFVPTYRPDEALNEDSNPFKTVGEDAVNEDDTVPPGELSPGIDYSKMPGFRG